MNKLLFDILTANRAEPDAWIETWLVPTIEAMGYDTIRDSEHNVYVKPQTPTTVLYVAHCDTVDHAELGDRVLIYDTETEIVELAASSYNKCLGADDGAGIYVLLRMLEHGVNAGFLFTTGEESGGIGIGHFIRYNAKELSQYQRCLEFDRMGTNEIIYNQCYGECSSDGFTSGLCEMLNSLNQHFKFEPSDEGLYTDNADLAEVVNECVNVAIGYRGHHTSKEWLDVSFVEALIDVMLEMSDNDMIEALPVDRVAGDFGEDEIDNWGWQAVGSDNPPYNPNACGYDSNGNYPVVDAPWDCDKPEATSIPQFCARYPSCVAELLDSMGYELHELIAYEKMGVL